MLLDDIHYVGIEQDIHKLQLVDKALSYVEHDSDSVCNEYGKYDTIVRMLEVNGIQLDYEVGQDGIISSIAKTGKESIKKVGELIKKLTAKAIELFKSLHLKLKVLVVKLSGFLDTLFTDIDSLSTDGMVDGKVDKDVSIHDKLNSIMGKYKQVTRGNDNGDYIDALLKKLNGKSPLFEASKHLSKLNSNYIKLIIKEEDQVVRSMKSYTKEAVSMANTLKGNVLDKSFAKYVTDKADVGVALLLVDPVKIKLMSFTMGKEFKSFTKDMKMGKSEEYTLNISVNKTKNWIRDLQSAKRNFSPSEAGKHVIEGYKHASDLLKSIESNKKAKPDLVRKAIAVNKYFTSIMYEEMKTNTRAYASMYDFLNTVSGFDSDAAEKGD